MNIMTSSEDEEAQQQQIRPEEEDDDTTSHSHRRRWSTPIDFVDEGVCGSGLKYLDEYFSCSSDNSYSFYLGQKISPWGSSGPPLLRPNATTTINATRGRGMRKATVTKRELPPFLTTLDCNGRPRFNHRRVRSEGRLEIASVAVDSPEIVSVRGRQGLRIGTVRISQ